MRYKRRDDGFIEALEPIKLADGTTIPAGTVGGYIDSFRNLSQTGNSWVYPNSRVTGNAYVSGDAVVGGYSVISDNARVYGSATILNGIIEKNARVLGKAYVQSGAIVTDEASVAGDAVVIGLTTIIGDRVKVQGGATVHYVQVLNSARVFGDAVVRGAIIENAHVSGYTNMLGNSSIISENARVSGCVTMANAAVGGDAIVYGTHDLSDEEKNNVVTDARFATNCPHAAAACPTKPTPADMPEGEIEERIAAGKIVPVKLSDTVLVDKLTGLGYDEISDRANPNRVFFKATFAQKVVGQFNARGFIYIDESHRDEISAALIAKGITYTEESDGLTPPNAIFVLSVI